MFKITTSLLSTACIAHASDVPADQIPQIGEKYKGFLAQTKREITGKVDVDVLPPIVEDLVNALLEDAELNFNNQLELVVDDVTEL